MTTATDDIAATSLWNCSIYMAEYLDEDGIASQVMIIASSWPAAAQIAERTIVSGSMLVSITIFDYEQIVIEDRVRTLQQGLKAV